MIVADNPQATSAEIAALNHVADLAERLGLPVRSTEAPRVMVSHEVWLGARELGIVAHQAGERTWLYLCPLHLSWRHHRGLVPDQQMDDDLRSSDLFTIDAEDTERVEAALELWRTWVDQWSDSIRSKIGPE